MRTAGTDETRASAADLGTPRAPGGPLGAFGGRARVEDGIGRRGDALVFPPRSAFVIVRLDAMPGTYRLSVDAQGAAGLRAELATTEGLIPLPLVRCENTFTVRLAIREAVPFVRMMPVEAGAVRFARFAFRSCGAWDSLLPDWRLGPVSLPHRQEGGAAVTAPVAPPGWARGVSVDAAERARLDGCRFRCGASGVVRLRFDPPLPAGLHVVSARFLADGGRDGGAAPALVAPTLWLPGAAPNAEPVARFVQRAGAAYVAHVRLPAPVRALLLSPREEAGEVVVDALAVRRLGAGARAARLARAGLGAMAAAALAPVERLVGGDPDGDGPVAALVRLATDADRRHRARAKGEERAALRRRLAAPVLRGGTLRVHLGPGSVRERARSLRALARCGDAAVALVGDPGHADLALRAGSRVCPEALAALRRLSPGHPVVCDTDRRTLGLASAPRFVATPGHGGAGLALTLVREPRGIRRPPPASPPAPPGGATVSLIAATRDAPAHLARFLSTLRATRHPLRETILLDNGTRDGAALALLAAADNTAGTRVVVDDRPFNFAALGNHGAGLASGDILVFANNDLAFTDPRWLGALVGALAAPGIGIAGALLDYPDGRVQHAGIVLAGEARVRHLERFAPSGDSGYLGRRRRLTPVTAVTGALLAVRRDLFWSLGGFDAARYPVLYNDVDFCLRARQAGHGCALVSAARAVHDESVSIGARRPAGLMSRGGPVWRMERAVEADRFRADWAELVDADPLYPAACDPLEAAFRARR